MSLFIRHKWISTNYINKILQKTVISFWIDDFHLGFVLVVCNGFVTNDTKLNIIWSLFFHIHLLGNSMLNLLVLFPMNFSKRTSIKNECTLINKIRNCIRWRQISEREKKTTRDEISASWMNGNILR